MTGQPDLREVFDRFGPEKRLQERGATGDEPVVLHEHRIMAGYEWSEAGSDLIGTGGGVGSKRNGAERHNGLLAQTVIETPARAGKRCRDGRVRVEDRMDIRSTIVDGKMHAQLAGRIPRTRNETTVEIDDNGVCGLEEAFAHAGRCNEQVIAVKTDGEIAGRAGSEAEPGNQSAEAHQLAAQQSFVCVGSCHVDLLVQMTHIC